MFTLTIGKHTEFHTGDPTVHDYGQNVKITVGNYCSMGNGIVFLAGGEHYYKRIATGLIAKLPDREGAYSKGDIIIGNDVWFGYKVTVMSGVTIGDGAVIGACSVVSKDIPPYAVACGNPIRIINYRFKGEQIEKLLKIKWWDWDYDKVIERAPLLESDNLDLLFQMCKV